MKLGPTYYEILGVSETATRDEIGNAIKEKLSLLNNPDSVNQNIISKFKLADVQRAFDVLEDIESRKNYDSLLHKFRNWQQYPEVFQEIIDIALASQDVSNLRELKAHMKTTKTTFNANVAYSAVKNHEAVTLRWLLTEGGIDLSPILFDLILETLDHNFVEGFEVILAITDIKKIATLTFNINRTGVSIGKIKGGIEELNLLQYFVKTNKPIFLKALIKAIKSSDPLNNQAIPSLWHSFLDKGRVYGYPEDTIPLFFYPAIQGQLEILDAFKKLGADVNILDQQQRNALVFIILNSSSLATIRKLLELGVDINQQMHRGHFGDFNKPPFAHNSVQSNINHILSKKFCAFSLAVYTQQPNVVNLFLEEQYLDKLNINTLNDAISIASILSGYNESYTEAKKFAETTQLLKNYRYKYYRYNALRLRYDRRSLNGTPNNTSLIDKIGYAIPEVLYFMFTAAIYFVPTFIVFCFSIEAPVLRPLVAILGSISGLGLANEVFVLNIPTKIKNAIVEGFSRLRSYLTSNPTDRSGVENSPNQTLQATTENTVAPAQDTSYSTFMGFSPYKASESLRQTAQASFAKAQTTAADNLQYLKTRLGYGA